MLIPKIKNSGQLKEYLLTLLDKVENDQLDHEKAAIASRICGDIIACIKTELVYAGLVKKEPNIPFLEECVKDASIVPKLVPMLNKNQ